MNANPKNIKNIIQNNLKKFIKIFYANIIIEHKFLKELTVNFIFNLIEKKIKIVLIIMYLMKLSQILFITIIT